MNTQQDLYAKYDVVVIGGGPVGLSTALECAKAGQKVLVLEQSVFFNYSGSSGDLVRMFRTAYTEDFMATLAVQSMTLWNELEEEAGEPMRLMSGLLNFGDPHYGEGGPEGTLLGPIPNLEKYNMKYTQLDRDEIQQQYPFQNLPDEWIGIDMPDNGCIDVTLLVRTLYRLCQERAVDLFDYSTVTRIAPDLSKVYPPAKWVIEGTMLNASGASAQGMQFSFRSDKIAITPGAYVNHVLYPSFGFSVDVNIWEMVYSYWAIDYDISFPKMWFQFQEDSTRDGLPVSNLFYGFPSVPWGPPNLCRIAVDTATNVVTDPDHRAYGVISPADLDNTRSWMINHVLGVGPTPLPVLSGTCLQTNVSDNMFVLDFVPERYVGTERDKSIVVFTAGWAMKFVPLLGRVLREMLLDGQTQYDVSQFSIDRKPDGKPIIRDGPVPNAPEVDAAAALSGSSRHMGH
ncbi:FAD/NAD(P)-binding domain-containing protein [Epithele typhae]|uniref:FAD/NAD(P)-binding domain-containing protein n=1 Tax=Epithele typhae TaxID=378194 RepID=UPI0020087BBB|nr:FAD/NAD(P)-binding domain-containing protein [Epithele typhae]KAH9927099.1 FAD/NAD(P)-binding domain-containing protein [Epithele typhae]